MGDAGVGKTSLIHQLTRKKFSQQVKPPLPVPHTENYFPRNNDAGDDHLGSGLQRQEPARARPDQHQAQLMGRSRCRAAFTIFMIGWNPGQERYRVLSRAYLRGCQVHMNEYCTIMKTDIFICQAAVVVFDVTRPETLQQVILISASCLIRIHLRPKISKLWYIVLYSINWKVSTGI